MYANIIRFRNRIGDELEGLAARLTAKTTRQTRLAGSTALVLILHGLLLWSLIVTHPEAWNLDHQIVEEPPLLVELWETQQPPEPKVQPVIVPREVVPQPRDVPQEAQQELPQETPQKAMEAPQPAPPQPVPVPEKPLISVEIPKGTPLDATAPATVSDLPAKPSLAARVKKKTQEELDAQRRETAAQMSDLNLHDTPNIDVPALQKVEPSGLAAAPSEGGRLGTLTPPAGLPSGTGTLKGGRGQTVQALQNHDYCATARQAGKPIPANCNMTDLASQAPLGPKPDASLQAVVRQKDATLRYKTAPGNTEYWQRVNRTPGPSERPDNEPKKGAYSDPKDQRVMGQCGLTDTCSQ